MKIRLAASLQPDSIVDGEGVRTVLWTQGCPHACPGCQNPGTHDFDGGALFDVSEVIDELKTIKNQDGITLSGGDPVCQAEACYEISKAAHSMGLNVWCYTGYTWEELMAQREVDTYLEDILNNIDVLLDGKFILSQKEDKLHYVGSANQRIIDVPKSLDNKEIVLYIDNSKILEGVR